MASIMWNKGEESLINTWLVGDTATVPTAGSGSWGVGMGCQTGGVGSDKTRVNGTNPASTIAELGTAASGNAFANYARQPLLRASSAWPLSSPPGAGQSYQSTASQVTFTFTGSPNQNGATLWFLAKSTTTTSPGANDCYFGSDLAATRNFTNGDTEKITITYRQQ